MTTVLEGDDNHLVFANRLNRGSGQYVVTQVSCAYHAGRYPILMRGIRRLLQAKVAPAWGRGN
jgi:hypothetical protein